MKVVLPVLLTCCLLLSKGLSAPPNIVYLISDDQTYTDFGFMGNERVHTPHLDALAARSALYPNGYVPASVCRPSLVTLLNGLYPHQHGIHFNHGPPGNAGYNRMTSRRVYEETRRREFQLIRKFPTLPGILSQELGYRCLQTGKFWEGHWRNGGFTEGMTTFEPPPPDQTFGGVRKLAQGERVAHGNGDAGLQIGRVSMDPIFRFIDDCEDEKSPWMVWYAPYLPHQPHNSPEKFYELARARPDVKEHELPYFASIAQFDETVGDLVRHVESRGLRNRTLFVFAVDNGWSPSRNRQKNRPVEFAPTKESKRAPFEDGLRTPVFLSWEGRITPSRQEGLVSTVDLLPTLLDAVGHPALPELPGRSLLPSAQGTESLSGSRPVFGAIYPGDASSLGHPERDVAYRWVRQGNHKLIVPHFQGKPTPWNSYLKEEALFDVIADPEESRNLIRDPALGPIQNRLQQHLDSWWNPAK